MFSDAESDEIGKPVSIEEIEFIINKMPKEKSPGPDGWTQELFHPSLTYGKGPSPGR
jgi:hypothetical protein